MTPARRIALLAAVVVIAVVGFIVLKPDEGSKKQSAEPASTPKPTAGTTETKPAQPPSPPVANIQVRDGKPVGGVRELEFSKGETVDFFVTSDVVDHVHVHGYDVMKDVKPGKRVRVKFKGRLDGQYEIELEDRQVEIATLKVNP